MNKRVDEVVGRLDAIISRAERGGQPEPFLKSLRDLRSISSGVQNELDHWNANLNNVFGVTGFGYGIGFFSVYLAGRFYMALLFSLAGLAVLLLSSNAKKNFPPTLQRWRESANAPEERRALKEYEKAVFGSWWGIRFWSPSYFFAIGYLSIAMCIIYSFTSIVESKEISWASVGAQLAPMIAAEAPRGAPDARHQRRPRPQARIAGEEPRLDRAH